MSVMPAPAASPAPVGPSPSSGARLVADDGRALSFQGGTLRAAAAGGLARLHLEQRFENVHAEPLQVTLQLPVPADAAVSGFSFTIGEETVVGRVDTKERARERFEEALLEGRTAALLEQDRSSLFRQRVGNVPPGETVVCEVVLDLMLAWENGGWTLRFPTVVAPRFQGAVGRVVDAARQLVGVAPHGTPARMGLELRLGDALTGPVASPSHVLDVDGTVVTLAGGRGASLDRDLVVRWPVAAQQPGLALRAARPAQGSELGAEGFGLLSLVPPRQAATAVPRDLVVLLDTSGSMRGAPLAQAQAVTRALIRSLGPEDQLQIIEFSTRPRAWRAEPRPATPGNQTAAIQWVDGLRAGGGTQMRSGILSALETLRTEAQRQVVLVTDGLIGFEREIVAAVAERLPRGCRVHTVGIGSAVNRSLLQPVARAGGGQEIIIGVDEPAQSAAEALVAATAAPQVVDLELSGSALREVAHHRVPDLMAGRPVRVGLRLDPAGGELVVRGHRAGADWEQRLTVAPLAAGEGDAACVALFGREQAEELELRAALGESVDSALEALGLRFQVSTRRTSWVAVSAQAMVDPTAPSRAELVPQALPHGMSVEGLGLRSAAGAPQGRTMMAPLAVQSAMAPGAAGGAPPMPSARPAKAKRIRRRASAPRRTGALPPPAPEPQADSPVPPPAAPAMERAEAPAEVEDAVAMSILDESADGESLELRADLAEDLDEVLDEEEPQERVQRAVAPRRLRGRIVLATASQLVVEIEVGGAHLDWTPPATVTVRTDRGPVTLALDPARSTRPSTLSSGQVLRLVLAPLPAGVTAAELRLVVRGQELIVELSRG